MPRWEHGSEDRLKSAALELFDERGFENTSVIEISERAGVTTRTFFRYFSDKREVLFAGSDELGAVLVKQILDAPDLAEPLRVVIELLSEFEWESLGSRAFQRRRQAVIAANPELLERDLIKQHGIAIALAGALRQRGLTDEISRLAAHVGVQLFFTAYLHWLAAGKKVDLTALSKGILSRLASIMPTDTKPKTSRC